MKYCITLGTTAYEVAVTDQNAEVVAVSTAVAPASIPVAPVAPVAAAAPAPTAPVPAPKPVVSAGGTSVNAPMPGNVMRLAVAVGDKVSEGQLLLVLEAMKMENEIYAPAAGTVSAIAVAAGATVDSGDLLLTIG